MADSTNMLPGQGSHFASQPPIEDFRTLDGLLRSHAAQKEQVPLVCYPQTGVADFEEHSASAIDQYVDAAVRFYIDNGLEPADPSREQAPVVAVLAPSSFDVVITIFALNRLGWAAFFLSTRLTAPVYARLLGLVDCSVVVVAPSHTSVVGEIRTDHPGCVGIPFVRSEDYRKPVAAFTRPGVDLVSEGQKLAWIVHSSGSTGLPKPIYLTNMQALANFRKTFSKRAICTSPLFHSHGLNELFRTFYARKPMYLTNYAYPLTSKNLVEAFAAAKPEQVCSVPYVLKLLAESPDGIAALARAQLVVFAGSSCPDSLGDLLVSQGVMLVANYGATESGQIMTSFRPPGDNEWQYMRLHRPVADHTLMDEIAPGVFECVALDGLPSKGPSNSKPPFSATNPENSFRTADLFQRHPDPAKSNFYKYLSRLDDRLTLVNGEKVLPLPIEGRIRHDEFVDAAVVFGYQRTVPGVLIFRSQQHGLHLSDEEYLEAVWPSVEAANLSAETFSRVPKDLIVIKGADVAYPKTDKGTFIRAQVYQQFAYDIENAYHNFESGSPTTGGGLSLDVAELEEWLLARFRKDLGVHIKDADTDIFSAGVDSLQTTRIWRLITKELDLGSERKALSQNIVFERGTIRSLANHLYQLRTGEDDVETGDDNEVATMRELIGKYSQFTHHFPASLAMKPKKDVVIVTGGTGNLGAFIIAALLASEQVSEVWALVRAPGPAAAGARVMNALTSRQINLSDNQLSKLHAIPSDLSLPDLGLPTHTLNHLLSSTTIIIHSAWAVNFNLGVRSFEAQHIRGTYNLLNFCLRSHLPTPAKLFFCSSVSAASGSPKPAIIPEIVLEALENTMKTGYGRSKLVTEHIVRNAMRSTGMYARVFRIGQLCGDTQSGLWNETEAVALMVRSAITAGALPALEEQVSWLPVDMCAEAAVELALKSTTKDADSPEDAELVYHLLNPHSFNWKTEFLPALKEKTSLPDFQIVAPEEWLEKLAQSEQDPTKNPSIKLFDFWKAKYTGSKQAPADEEPAGLTFETNRTLKDCNILNQARDPVSAGLMEKYVDTWMKSWTRT